VASTGVNRLDDVGGDHIESLAGQRQEVASVVHADADVGLLEHAVGDVREVRCSQANAVGELDDLHRGSRKTAHRARRRATAQPDNQRRFRRRVQRHRQRSDPAMQEHHRL